MIGSTIRRAALSAAFLVTAVPAVAERSALLPGQQEVVFAGGCFWGVQGVFQHVKGVITATSGYAGGAAGTAHYNNVSDGDTGHAEAVRVVFDTTKVSYETLLKVFFSVVHDPTELNRQGPDVGTQYRSAIFFTTPVQQNASLVYIAQLAKSKAFSRPIVTQVTPLRAFYNAEDYHQDYATLHPTQPYIAYNDLPKIAALQKNYPELWKASIH